MVADRSPSILHRILWLHLLALTGIWLAIIAAAYFLLNSTVDDFEKRILRDHALSVSRHLDLRDGRWLLSLPPDLKAIYDHAYGGYALAVIGSDGRIIYSSLPNARPFFSEAGKAQPAFFHQKQGASIYYGMTMPVVRGGNSVWIQVGQNLENPDVIVDDVVALFLGRIAWFVVPIVGILLVADVLLVRRQLAPIIAASHVASSIGPNKPLLRLPTDNLPREVLPLAAAVNEALERLEGGLRAQREFTADAAHELRTPLAILRTHVDTMLDNEAAHALQKDIDAMSHVVDQLLELAELEGLAIGGSERVDLNALCADVVGMMAPIALADNKSLELTSPPAAVTTFGKAELLARAVINLVENAIRHANPGTNIEVEVASPATIHVKDRGPGIKPSERELIFHRFWRKDRQDKGHAGLGLAIVAKIVQLHRGSVKVTSRNGGGALFSIALPAAPVGTAHLPNKFRVEHGVTT
jgi:signal transduction histidine kinase